MAILKRLHILFLLPSLLTGCYQEFEPDINTDPVLCVNSLITAGEPVAVEVTRTWVYNRGNGYTWNSYDETQPPANLVDDAKVYVYANGQLTSGEYIAEEGDTIRIVAESVKYGSAEATVVVPVAVPITIENVRPQLLRVWKDSEYPVKSTIHFNLGATLGIGRTTHADEYFRMQCRGVDCWDGGLGDGIYWIGNGFLGDVEDMNAPYANFQLGDFNEDSDPVFKEHITILDDTFGFGGRFTCFTNRLFAGKGYDLNVQLDKGYLSVYSPEYNAELFDCKVEFTLMTVSGSYYNTMLYEWELENGALGEFNDTGLSDPVWGYSNVSTNAGVVAARAVSTCTVSLRDFFETAFNDAPSETY